MQKVRMYIKYILKAACAVALAGIIVNILMFAYNRQPGWLERKSGATSAVWNPGTYIVQGEEGYGIHKVDANGYLNEGTLADEGYVLAAGSSQTEGKEVKAGQRYSDVLNALLIEAKGLNGDRLWVYNVSMDSHVLPNILEGFNALVQEFPCSSAIVLEFGSTDITMKEFDRILKQRPFNVEETGSGFAAQLTGKNRIKLMIKEYFPLLNQIKSRSNQIAKLNKPEDVKEESRRPTATEYCEQIRTVFQQMSDVYDGQVIFLFHPTLEVTNEGLQVKKDEMKDIFVSACEEIGFTFADMTEPFLDAYERERILPYGFSNTTLGAGHLNKYGHKMIAEELFNVINNAQ